MRGGGIWIDGWFNISLTVSTLTLMVAHNRSRIEIFHLNSVDQSNGEVLKGCPEETSSWCKKGKNQPGLFINVSDTWHHVKDVSHQQAGKTHIHTQIWGELSIHLLGVSLLALVSRDSSFCLCQPVSCVYLSRLSEQSGVVTVTVRWIDKRNVWNVVQPSTK